MILIKAAAGFLCLLAIALIIPPFVIKFAISIKDHLTKP